MTKECYVDEVVDIVDQMLNENNWYDDYELSTANEGANVDRSPILVVEYPDESCRAYDIPFRPALVENIESANELNIAAFVEQVKAEITAFETHLEGGEEETEEETEVSQAESEERESHSDDFYEEYDTDSLSEFTEMMKDYMADNDIEMPEGIDTAHVFEVMNNKYQCNSMSFLETMEYSLDSVLNSAVEDSRTSQETPATPEAPAERRRHTEDFYEEFDTDFTSQFVDMASQYIKDNAPMMNAEPGEIIECLDFDEIFLEYQNNDNSFRQVLLTALNEIGVLDVNIDEIYNLDGEEQDEDEDEEYEDEYEEDEDEEEEEDYE